MRYPGFSRPRGNLMVVFGLIVLAIAFQLAAPNETWTRAVTILLQGAVVIAALRAAGAVRHLVVAATAAYVLLAAAATAAIGFADIGPTAPRLLSLALVLLAPAAIVIAIRRGLEEEGQVSIRTVAGALGLYLLIGLGFAFAFNVVQDISNEPFFSGGVTGDPNEFLYFSLVTLTTTGYGDFTAAAEVGRALAALEALTGQIFLVTVIAITVSNLRRRPGGREQGVSASPGP